MLKLKHQSVLAILLLSVGGSRAVNPPDHPIIAGLEPGSALAPKLQGRILLTELNCTSCHAAGKRRAELRPKPAPDLAAAAARINHPHLLDYLTDPLTTQPGATMPDALSHLAQRDKQRVARAIVQYLISLSQDAAPAEPVRKGSLKRGKELYHSVGCVACHSPEQSLADSVPLGALERKYPLNRLVQFLENPLAIRPGGRMPDMQLTHFEAIDVATYLLRQQTELPPRFKPDAQLAETGKSYFAQYGCAACHAVTGVKSEPALALARLRPGAGCLSGKIGPWPRYALSATQKAALHAALNRPAPVTDGEQQIRVALTRFNCIGCHQRGDFGGIAEERNEYFTTDNLNLGEQGRIPPPLTGVGAKLKPDWLRQVLAHGESVRPYMKTRMPRFGESNVVQLVSWFGEADTLPPAKIARVNDRKLARDAGRALVGSKGLNCIACHTFNAKSAANIRALEMTTMTARLQENWFHHYLIDPQQFRPLIIMPTYWPEGNTMLEDILDGDTGKQIDALWQYLSEGRNVGEPRGLVLEPLPLVVHDEAVMLRRSYPGIGKRGIGVGYPSGINLSFDAGQMRLGSIWRGEFIEASPVWRGQGAGSVRILGTNIVRFPVGPALAWLESSDTPWPEDDNKKAKGFQFKGYTLDKKRRPTFRYEFQHLALTDQFLDRTDAAGRSFFRRTLIFAAKPPSPHLYLRLAVEKTITQPAANTFQTGRLLKLIVPAGGLIRPHAKGQELILPIDGQSRVTIEYHW